MPQHEGKDDRERERTRTRAIEVLIEVWQMLVDFEVRKRAFTYSDTNFSPAI